MMKKLNDFKIFGTKEGSKKSIKLDEISIIANPKEMRELGIFLINAAYEMEMNDLEHVHLQDLVSNFSYEKHVDVIALNKAQIKIIE